MSSVQRQVLVNTAMNVRIPQKARNLAANCTNINFKGDLHEARSIILEKNVKNGYDLVIMRSIYVNNKDKLSKLLAKRCVYFCSAYVMAVNFNIRICVIHLQLLLYISVWWPPNFHTINSQPPARQLCEFMRWVSYKRHLIRGHNLYCGNRLLRYFFVIIKYHGGSASFPSM